MFNYSNINLHHIIKNTILVQRIFFVFALSLFLFSSRIFAEIQLVILQPENENVVEKNTDQSTPSKHPKLEKTVRQINRIDPGLFNVPVNSFALGPIQLGVAASINELDFKTDIKLRSTFSKLSSNLSALNSKLSTQPSANQDAINFVESLNNLFNIFSNKKWYKLTLKTVAQISSNINNDPVTFDHHLPIQQGERGFIKSTLVPFIGTMIQSEIEVIRPDPFKSEEEPNKINFFKHAIKNYIRLPYKYLSTLRIPQKSEDFLKTKIDKEGNQVPVYEDGTQITITRDQVPIVFNISLENSLTPNAGVYLNTNFYFKKNVKLKKTYRIFRVPTEPTEPLLKNNNIPQLKTLVSVSIEVSKINTSAFSLTPSLGLKFLNSALEAGIRLLNLSQDRTKESSIKIELLYDLSNPDSRVALTEVMQQTDLSANHFGLNDSEETADTNNTNFIGKKNKKIKSTNPKIGPINTDLTSEKLVSIQNPEHGVYFLSATFLNSLIKNFNSTIGPSLRSLRLKIKSITLSGIVIAKANVSSDHTKNLKITKNVTSVDDEFNFNYLLSKGFQRRIPLFFKKTTELQGNVDYTFNLSVSNDDQSDPTNKKKEPILFHLTWHSHQKMTEKIKNRLTSIPTINEQGLPNDNNDSCKLNKDLNITEEISFTPDQMKKLNKLFLKIGNKNLPQLVEQTEKLLEFKKDLELITNANSPSSGKKNSIIKDSIKDNELLLSYHPDVLDDIFKRLTTKDTVTIDHFFKHYHASKEKSTIESYTADPDQMFQDLKNEHIKSLSLYKMLERNYPTILNEGPTSKFNQMSEQTKDWIIYGSWFQYLLNKEGNLLLDMLLVLAKNTTINKDDQDHFTLTKGTIEITSGNCTFKDSIKEPSKSEN